MSIKNVIVIGAGGNLGPAILNALDKDPQFTVSVLSRKTSKSTFPSHIKVHQIDDSYPEDQLLSAFKGQDAIVSTINAATNQHVIIEAAVKAGVKRYIPSEFGGDTTNAKVVEVVPVFKGKLAVVDSLKKQESNGLSWTALVTGPFFDWGIKVKFLGFNLAEKTATIFDSGNHQWPATTLPTIGLAICGILKKPEETANKYLFVDSFVTSQNEVLAALEKSTGQKWTVNHSTADSLLATGREKLGNKDFSGIMQLIQAGVYGEQNECNYTTRETLSNGLLGLPKETVQDEIAKIVKG
ncbi:hypothetical protein MMC06_006075 [Schaereria dolodes]|nr:hypothetical protein [Schaereria dolodes]